MITCNGVDYLSEQIESLIEQSHSEWELCVFDDGSSDQALAVLDGIASSTLVGRFQIFAELRQEFAKNFLIMSLSQPVQ